MKRLPEAEVVHLWQESLLRQKHWRDSEGEPVEVVYPGRWNDGRGGDYREAVITAGNRERFGCIEIHTLSGDWQAHGHQSDPAYNQVVLHVALESASGRAGRTVLENGRSIPTVILRNNLPSDPPSGKPEICGLPCSGAGLKSNAAQLGKSLEQAGVQRYEAKVKHYLPEIGRIGAEQSFYQGFLEALGYTKNQMPFRKLARLLPVKTLQKPARAENDRERYLANLQALWIGSAGLLPSQRPLPLPSTDYINELEQIWARFKRSRRLSYREWEPFKVRPANYPVRRLAALSYLFYRYREKGWLPALLGLVGQVRVDKGHTELESALIVAGEGYWSRHYDIGCPDPAANPLLLGQGCAAQIIINVLLPFASAWGRTDKGSRMDSRAREIYRQYPTVETNSIERHMFHQLSLNSRLVDSACRQQGLIHLYKAFCIQGKCRECSLG
jgi:hypothetical protein